MAAGVAKHYASLRPGVKKKNIARTRWPLASIGRGLGAAARSAALAIGVLLSVGMEGVLAYDIYDDGSISESLPGSASDSRKLPNIPFFVDGNRLSDGVSSVSPLSTTSPAFPLYENDTNDDADQRRREWANAAVLSQLAQGVAPRGAGAFETAVARYSLLSGNVSSTEKPATVFAVNAWERWNPSTFAIQQGQTYTLAVQGEQFWQDGLIRVDSGGYEAQYDAVDACWVAVGSCRSYLGGNTPRLPRARWMQLVCGIGNFVTILREATSGKERYLPIRDEDLQKTLFPVEHNVTFVAEETGELVCFANDAEGLYGNNRLSLNVTVTRDSWPPNGTYAENYEAYVASAPTVGR